MPVYVFGEDKLYTSISLFMGLRKLIVKVLRVGIVLFFGRAEFFGLIPHQVPLVAVLGEPLWPKGVNEDTQKHVVKLRTEALQALKRKGADEEQKEQEKKKPASSAAAAGATIEFAKGKRVPRHVTAEEVNEMHDRYVAAMEHLFEKYKSSQPAYAKSTLQVLSARG